MDNPDPSVGKPVPYTPEMHASRTLQASDAMADDNPTDVNQNAGIARVQAQTTMLVGSEFGAAAARRTTAGDAAQERRQIIADMDLKKA